MTSLQKIIKYFAIAFAMVIIVNIIGVIMFGVYHLGSLFGLSRDIETMELKYQEVINNDIDRLDIDLTTTIFEIHSGTEFQVQYSNDNIKINQKENKLEIEDKGFHWFQRNKNKVVLTIPEGLSLKEAKIDTGAGTIFIETLSVENLKLNLGAGKALIENLYVENRTKIDGGAGEIEILNGSINNLDLDMGVGKFLMNSRLTGTNEIDAGVGKLEINLEGSENDYSFRIDKGIGSIKLNGKELNNDTSYQNGVTSVKISGGVGEIEIKTEEY